MSAYDAMLVSCPDPTLAQTPPLPRPHPCREEKGSGYNTTSRLTLEGRNQHTIVTDHVLTYAIYGVLSIPRRPHCGAYYFNCAVIGHFTCQTAYVTGSGGMSYCNQPLLLSGRVGSGHETNAMHEHT